MTALVNVVVEFCLVRRGVIKVDVFAGGRSMVKVGKKSDDGCRK